MKERVADFNFHLPEELIAQQPPQERDAARMLVLDRATGAVQDSSFRALPQILNAGDLLVLNDSRVIPARLFATRAGATSQKQQPSGSVEVLLTQQLGPQEWSALVRPGRKVQIGERLFFAANDDALPLLEAEVTARGEFGERTLPAI